MHLCVLLSAPYLIPDLDAFRPYFEGSEIELTVADVQERLSEDELLGYAGSIDGAICGDDRFTQRVLENATPRLKVISKWGTGVDSIDLEAADSFGVKVFNTPGAFTEPVADSVMGYVLAFARQQVWLDREMKSLRWAKLPARALHECTLGVVGVGRIGQAVLRRARGFGMRSLGNDILQIDPELVESLEVEMVSLKELLERSDFVSLNCDLNPTSRGLIDAEKLGWMRPDAVLINTARGPVVQEDALVDALRSGALGGAALDVFEEEPLPAESQLRDFDQVMLSPHNANSSRAAWERVHWNTVRNLFIGLGLPPPQSTSPSEESED